MANKGRYISLSPYGHALISTGSMSYLGVWSKVRVFVRKLPHHTHQVYEMLGFDVITKISEIPTDEKARPEQPVTVLNCGELVLWKKAVTSPAPPVNGGANLVKP